jgi:ATP-dependent DNA helicase RecQ
MFSTTSTFIQRHYNSDIPLIALMKDQVDSLKAMVYVACYINSSQSTEEQQSTHSKIISGSKNLYMLHPSLSILKTHLI